MCDIATVPAGGITQPRTNFFTIPVQVLDPLPDGMGEWVTLYAPKWDYLWVETYRPIDTPVDFKFWYRLHEYGNELQDLPFENGWYTTEDPYY